MLKMIDFKGIHEGEAGWIVGNGPSLNEMDLTFLNDKVNFCMNRIYLGVEEMGFTPKYYTVEDVFVAEDTPDEINALKYCKFLPKDLDYCLKEDENVCWVDFLRRYDGFPKFSADADEVVYWGSTVTYLAMQLAYYMGCDPIYLIGVDFDYVVPDYADGPDITSREADQNHFHPDYFGPGKRWHHPRLDLVEKAYIESRRFIEGNGRRIYNAGVGGKLTIFERVNYLDVR
ncbi:6-hydroxymethylpterin diphosphokinase MptE-like protein [uncultured Pseudodesulfovibrio sp.]|uniref:6-hydroxymethylpterin diphosphokinase MptE-like protein n=1 Tax=uncultured Pseudodesulfovibrio sp. TaxID=2035858 RepID=UPI0029C763C9|nr:6-hydroxymethylpterin diphosphokinase MptE-like protein [uncultured Pseudodesulfovibrio sp.]